MPVSLQALGRLLALMRCIVSVNHTSLPFIEIFIKDFLTLDGCQASSFMYCHIAYTLSPKG